MQDQIAAIQSNGEGSGRGLEALHRGGAEELDTRPPGGQPNAAAVEHAGELVGGDRASGCRQQSMCDGWAANAPGTDSNVTVQA